MNKEEIKDLQEKYTQALEVAQERFDRIQKAIEDLEKTKKYNKNKNGLIKVDIDHIEYLLDILKGEE